MNIATDSPPPKPQADVPADPGFDLPDALEAREDDKLTDAIAQLETTLVAERDAWREKEFIYIAVIALLGSVIFFKFLENNPLALLLVTLFEAIILFGLAKRLGVDWAERSYGWLAHVLAKRLAGDDGGKE